jgi:hypothetical protein
MIAGHPSWEQMKSVLSSGSKWPLEHLEKSKQPKDIEEAIKVGNRKGAVWQDEHLQKLVEDNAMHGFILPLSINKISSIPGVLLAPLNIQAQTTINEHSKIIPKNRITHNQSRKCQLGTSVNRRVDAEKLNLSL